MNEHKQIAKERGKRVAMEYSEVPKSDLSTKLGVWISVALLAYVVGEPYIPQLLALL